MSFARITKNFTTAQIAKQLPFAIASGLTQTAKDAQAEAGRTLDDKFTLRSNWWKPSNKFGIRVRPAKKTNLQAEVGTDADWLDKFETGKDKTPRGQHIAIPTANVRRNKRQIIPKGQRPAALRGKRTFVLQTKSGPVLYQRKYKGKRSAIVALYNLETRAKIQKKSPIIEPALKSIRQTLNKNFLAALDNALKTAK